MKWEPFSIILPSGLVIGIQELRPTDVCETQFRLLFGASVSSAAERARIADSYKAAALNTTLLIQSLCDEHISPPRRPDHLRSLPR